jgi:hypothetical protein
MYTMTLSDGTKLENLELNGNNWISSAKLTEKDFEGKLNKVSVTDGEVTEEYEKQILVQITEVDGKYWFVLRGKTRQEEIEDSITETQVALAEIYEQMLGGQS